MLLFAEYSSRIFQMIFWFFAKALLACILPKVFLRIAIFPLPWGIHLRLPGERDADNRGRRRLPGRLF